MKVEFWPTEKPQPYDKNPRVISDQAVAKVAMSLREYGFQQPIVVDAQGVIVAGHTRLRAAKSLGLKKVPVVVADLPEEKARAYRLADNRTNQEASWDDDILAEELDVLKDLGFDLSLTGFDVDEIGKLLAEATEGLTDPDETPEPPVNPVTVLGDVWVLGRHRIICGDSTKAEDVERVLNGVKPHLMVTDPPYGVEYDPTWRDGVGAFGNTKMRGKVENDDRADWTEVWSLFPGDVAYVWHGALHATTVAANLESAGFHVRSQIIWTKQHFAMSRGDYHWMHEPCWYALRKGRTGHWAGDRKQTTVWAIESLNPSGRKGGDAADGKLTHGTQKPVECMKRPIENNSSPGQAVYEPFSGSGTTIIAAEMTGRSCHAIELNPAYVDVAIKRWQDFTGQKATLDGDGRTFEEIDAERYSKTGAPDNSAKSYDVAIAKLREAHEAAEAKPKKGKVA